MYRFYLDLPLSVIATSSFQIAAIPEVFANTVP
jgi:hypothetical protein